MESSRPAPGPPQRIDRVLRSHLKLRHLQLLVALEEARHLGKAADGLGMTQSSASKALAEIEGNFGFALFSRSARGTHPTAYGESVTRFARSVLAEFDRTRRQLDALALGDAGRVSIGTMGVAMPVLLSRAIALLKGRSPGITVFVDEGFLDGLLPRLRAGEFDFVLGRLEVTWTPPDLQAEALCDDPLAVVCAPGHPLSRRSRLTWSDLAGEPWMVPRQGAPVRMRLEQTFLERGLDFPADRVEITSFLTVLSLLRERPSLAVLTHSAARRYERDGLLRILPIAFPQPLAPVGIISVRSRAHSPASELLQSCLRRVAQVVGGDHSSPQARRARRSR